MATKTSVLLTDDLSDDDTVADETVSFSLDSTQYEIDLSDENAKEMRDDLSRYIAAARVVSKPRGRAASTGKSSSTAADKERLQKIRTWAAANGHSVAERGRIKAEVVEAYEAANA